MDIADKGRQEVTKLAAVDDKRRLYGVMLADDDMDVATYQAARERLSARERDLTAELAESTPLTSRSILTQYARAGPVTPPMSDGR